MHVIKRSGLAEPVSLDKIVRRIQKLIDGPGSALPPVVDAVKIAQEVVSGLFSGVTTVRLDVLAAETAAALIPVHPDYGRLAARITASNMAKQTPATFSAAMEKIYAFRHPKTGAASVLCDELMATVRKHRDVLDAAICADRDYEYTYFGLRTLQNSYLLKTVMLVEDETFEEIVERPCYMLMRVALGIHGEDIEAALETYDHMSRRIFTHATPTLFNAGTKKPQCSSCFLETMEDSISGIYGVLAKTAEISKHAGGIGLDISNIRSKGSYIAGSQGTSSGLVPMLRVWNESARYVDQLRTLNHSSKLPMYNQYHPLDCCSMIQHTYHLISV